MFQLPGGLAFERQADGSVKLTVTTGGAVAVYTIDRDSWVSAVTEMSHNPGATTHALAHELHIAGSGV